MKKRSRFKGFLSKHAQQLLWLKEMRCHQGTGSRTSQDTLQVEKMYHNEHDNLSHEYERQRSSYLIYCGLSKAEAHQSLLKLEHEAYQHERMLYAYQKD